MSALVFAVSALLRPMNGQDLDAVLALEQGAYSHPWSRGNFADSLAAGHHCEVAVDAATSELLAYLVAQPGVDEMHLLNLAVAPAHRRRGHAQALMARLVEQARARAQQAVWLEVRAGNQRALHFYEACGFQRSGLRRGYYPSHTHRREDAVLMTLELGSAQAA